MERKIMTNKEHCRMTSRTTERFEVEFSAGESRYIIDSENACMDSVDYMMVELPADLFLDEEGFEPEESHAPHLLACDGYVVELYAECSLEDEEVTESGDRVDDFSTYDDLKASILEQAAERNIPAECLKFYRD